MNKDLVEISDEEIINDTSKDFKSDNKLNLQEKEKMINELNNIKQ